MKRVVDLYGIAGAIASVRVPGEAEWTQASGFADIASRTPSNPSGHYPIRSVTKSVTVTLVLQIVRDQSSRSTTSSASSSPAFPTAISSPIADLAGNQSGIAGLLANAGVHRRLREGRHAAFTPQELVDYAIPYSPKFAPGASYDYSNTNTVLLGVIVEQWRNVARAGARRAHCDAARPLATSYPDTVRAAGSASDALRGRLRHARDRRPAFHQSDVARRLGRHRVDARGHAGVGAGARGRAPRRRAIAAAADRSLATGTNGPHYDRYGLGIGILDGWLGHTGNGIGFTAATFYDPRTKATIAVLVNSTRRRRPTRRRTSISPRRSSWRSRRSSRRADYDLRPAYFSPAETSVLSQFCGGGSGHVVYAENAQGGLYALLKSTTQRHRPSASPRRGSAPADTSSSCWCRRGR